MAFSPASGADRSASSVGAHPYLPNSTDETKAAMLAAVGVDSVDALFEQIPDDHICAGPDLLPPGIRSEVTLHRRVRELVDRNEDCVRNLSFLGAGYWQHHVPAVCDEIAGRSEFLTPVWGTPSSDLGRNQAWFEFASQLGELVGMEFVGLPVYSWGAAIGHAFRMASRITGRDEVIVPGSLDPEKSAVVGTLCGSAYALKPITLRVAPLDVRTGQLGIQAVSSLISERTAAVYVETPNYFGLVEQQAPEIAALARRNGAETVMGVDPISLGVLAPPSELGADIAVGSIQPLGIHLNAGGGAGGFIATRDEERYARQYPTLQVSIADTTRPGQRSFGMTLFHQSSYGSREEGNDWTGNSVYLWAVVSAVYMALLGPTGFAEIGRTISSNSAYSARRMQELDGVSVRWPSGFFKEFVVDFGATGRTVAAINAALRRHRIFGGKDLSADFPQLGQSALYCVTEVHTAADIDALFGALKEVLA